MQLSKTYQLDDSMYVLTIDGDTVSAEVLPPSPTTALISHLMNDEVMLAGAVLLVFAGRNDDGPAKTEEEAATQLRDLTREMWEATVAYGDPDYLAWAQVLGAYNDVDWIIITRFVVGAAASECPPARAVEILKAARTAAAADARPTATAGRLQ